MTCTGLDQINQCYCSFDFCLTVISQLTLGVNSQNDGNDGLPTEGSFWLSIVIVSENLPPLLDFYHTKIILVLLRSMRLIDL